MKVNSFQVNYMYDSSVDVLAIKVKEKFIYSETIEMDEDILLDFDMNNIPVSLEILDASKQLETSKRSLENIVSFNMKVFVNEDLICIDANFGINSHNNQKSFQLTSLANNYAHIPNIIAELSV